MNKINQILKAKMLLQQAMTLASQAMPNSHVIAEAKGHIKQAMAKIDNIAKTQIEKKAVKQNDFKDWWDDVVSGTVDSPTASFSQETYVKTLKNLDSMIAEEKQKLEDLEKDSNTKTNQPQTDLFVD